MSLAEAQKLMRQGRLPEAESAFERLLERDPAQVEALNVLGLAALRDGRAAHAAGLLRRAAAADPRDPVTQHHLARALEAGGDFPAALLAHETAVRLQPDFMVARLFWAAALERLGRMDQAVVQYVRALNDAQMSGRWLNPESTPAVLRPAIEHAVHSVRHHRAAAFARLFEPLVERYGHEALERVAKTLRIYFNQEAAKLPDSRQRPTFLFMPGLPASAYLERSLFPWIAELEAQTAAIQAELAQLLPFDRGSERVFSSEEIERENLRGAGSAPSWTGYYFFRHGIRRVDNCTACPNTARALDALPLSRVRDHGPEVLFSVFTPGTHLLPHRGVTNTRLVAHLPLLVPEDCALNVGGEIHAWKEGRVVVFDDTYEHEAWNRGKSTRVVLIFDIWNPYLTEVERAALADLIHDIGDFRETVEKA